MKNGSRKRQGKGSKQYAKMKLKLEPKSINNQKILEKMHAEIDRKICYFSKGAKK